MPSEEPAYGVKSFPDLVDVRFIVMTFDRKDSVMKCLQSLQGIELDGDKGAIDVFIDRGPKGTDNATLQALSGFRWNHGPVHVHPQITHVGMVGQWVDSWWAQPNSSEIAIILEDDIDLSRYAYRWLKAAYRQYGHLPHVGGFSLNEATIPGMKSLPSDVAFMHAIIGTKRKPPCIGGMELVSLSCNRVFISAESVGRGWCKIAIATKWYQFHTTDKCGFLFMPWITDQLYICAIHKTSK